MDWDEVRNEYEVTDITLSDLAKKYDIKPGTLRSRKNRDKWQRGTSEEFKSNDAATQRNAVATQKAVAQLHDSDLNDKQKLFCLYYLQRFNATWAYQQAYQVNYETAHKLSSRLMANDGIKNEIDILRKQQQQDLYLNANDILREYVKQAFADIGDFVEFGTKVEIVRDGCNQPVKDKLTGDWLKTNISYVNLKNSELIDTSLINEIHMGRDGAVVKLYDKQKAMKELLERLPEPTNDSIEQDSFLQAIKEATKKQAGNDS